MALGEDETASIDISMTFFAAILLIFVFVAFNLAPEMSPPTATLGQNEETVEALPATWNPVAERGSFALLSGGVLNLLDMKEVARGIVDPTAAVSTEANHASFLAGEGPAPNEFGLALSFTPGALPGAWVSDTLVPEDDTPCPVGLPSVLTVWVDHREPGLAQTLSWAASCQLRLRVEVLPPAAPSGRVSRAISLDADSFAMQRMFR